MMNARKGQVATEFFMYSAVFLVIVLGAYFSIFLIQNAEISNKESLYVQSFGETFASHLNTAMAAQGGFNYTMIFERQVLGRPYAVQFKPADGGGRNGFVFITWIGGSNVTYSYPVGRMPLKASGTCITAYTTAPADTYYEINTTLGALNFYNDGENITLSQKGCT